MKKCTNFIFLYQPQLIKLNYSIRFILQNSDWQIENRLLMTMLSHENGNFDLYSKFNITEEVLSHRKFLFNFVFLNVYDFKEIQKVKNESDD